jgi:Transposase DDE domain
MVSLEPALRCVKENLSGVLSRQTIEQACERQGYTWRAGPLDPAQTVRLFLRQVVEGNVAGTEVVRLAGGGFTEAAWCQAKQRFPLAVLRDLSEQVRDRIGRSDMTVPESTWRGDEVCLVDASNFSMPDTPDLRRHFGEVPGQKPGCGFPIAHLLLVFNLLSGVLIYDEASAFKTGDVNNMPHAHPSLRPGTVLLGDDTFGSFAHIALLLQRNLHGVFPSHHARTVDFTPRRMGGPNAPKGKPRSKWVRSLGTNDQIVEIYKPTERTRWLTAEMFDALPDSIQIREIKRKIRRKGFAPRELIVVTTLLDPVKYPADAIIALRGRRWEVETDIRHLKTTMNMEVLRSQTPQGVLKDLAVFGIVYNLTRAVMLESARRQKVSPVRLSFADGLAWVCHAEPAHSWPKLKVVPQRPDRIEPRAVKRRPKPFALMNRPRSEMRKRIKDKYKRR